MLKPALILLATLPLSAQTFEVASVKPSAPDARGSTFNFTTGGGLTVKNGILRGIIETAYDVRDFQIVGGPAWLNSEHFDIFAKSTSGEAPPGRVTPTAIHEARVKLQALLADRFQLKVHHETRELPIYALVAAKNGPKLTEVSNAPEGGGYGIRSACGQLVGTYTGMDNLATMLSRQLGRPVQDRTGLAAKYNFQVNWTPDAGPCEENAPDRPSLFAALQEQLGLKLESTKGPVEIIAVDHAEKPTGN